MKKAIMLVVIGFAVLAFVTGCETTRTSGQGKQPSGQVDGQIGDGKDQTMRDTDSGILVTDVVDGEEVTVGEISDVYFAYDSYSISADARAVLKENARILNANENLRITIEGHCDERGSAEYNMALGERRATAVKNYLKRLGVSTKRIKMTSYGKEKPVCFSSNESCWQKNRRSHFKVNK
ncbi:MAG: peptidoglycan-associated lipoprotein Pal [Deltaproteobacteria bacterium]|nr:peptidoglycan-associated lipoprotein Pal [Deltaproteobacteria bacterium]